MAIPLHRLDDLSKEILSHLRTAGKKGMTRIALSDILHLNGESMHAYLKYLIGTGFVDEMFEEHIFVARRSAYPVAGRAKPPGMRERKRFLVTRLSAPLWNPGAAGEEQFFQEPEIVRKGYLLHPGDKALESVQIFRNQRSEFALFRIKRPELPRDVVLPISVGKAEMIMENSCEVEEGLLKRHILYRDRYEFSGKNRVRFIMDVFKGRLGGLIILMTLEAEYESQGIGERTPIKFPDELALGGEITGDRRFKDSALARLDSFAELET